eukprot:127572_1
MSVGWIHAFYILFNASLFVQILRSHVISKSVTLTPNHLSGDGATIYSHIKEVHTINNTWIARHNISQQSWQFILILDGSWGFDSNVSSSIQITLHSPSVTTENSIFDSLLFGFTTDNNEYISTFITSNQTEPNKIYPNCDPITPQTPARGDIASLPSFNRTCDIAGGSCTNWTGMKPVNQANIPSPTPFTLYLRNDPLFNTLSVSYQQNADHSVQRCAFRSLQTKNGLKLYIGVNGANPSFHIQSFEIDANSNTSSANVTQYPTQKTTSTPIEDVMLITNVFSDHDSIGMVTQSNQFRNMVFPASVAATCLILLVIIRIGFKHKRQDNTAFERSAVAFEHVESFSVINGYFIRVHCGDMEFVYEMMNGTDVDTAPVMSCTHWKESKYNRFIHVIVNEFKLHTVAFRLYELVNGEEEDINGIDDIIVAFDCVMKETDTLASIDIYVDILENGVPREMKHIEPSAMVQNHWYNMGFRHTRCKKNSIDVEKKRNRQKAIDNYLEEKVLEIIEVTATDDGVTDSQSTDTLNYYD